MTFLSQPILVNGDALPYVKTLPDASIDLILTDPPYSNILPWIYKAAKECKERVKSIVMLVPALMVYFGVFLDALKK
ncbi:DNA N-6-adenine-methyltransferase [Arsenophonus nasoniae]|uniref:DNA N-6-adenine-methyltransferase n=1 Tax=Arsenophonus nasoniae TaxID=638 RepID=UPI00387A154C